MEIGNIYLGKKIIEKHEFNVEGTFKSFYSASAWAKAKWHNISREERQLVHGVMISDYFREKPVTILIFEQ